MPPVNHSPYGSCVPPVDSSTPYGPRVPGHAGVTPAASSSEVAEQREVQSDMEEEDVPWWESPLTGGWRLKPQNTNLFSTYNQTWFVF